MTRRLADERGSALTMFAVMAPMFILFLALALDVGNWFTHKRNLQNRADAAALAAGVEYAKNNNAMLLTCKAGDPGGTAAADITSWAKKYAGDPSAAGPVNTQVANQGSLAISVNSSTYGGADNSDGGGPCFNHAANAGDFISPNGGYWTDVRVKESNIPTFFGTFGINVPAITARARLDIRAVGSINPLGPSIPFVGQSGDFVDCAWAEFVDTNTGNPLPAAQVGGGKNPVPLQAVSGQDRTWETTLTGPVSPTSFHDIAVLGILGLPSTPGDCATPPSSNDTVLPDSGDGDLVGGVDWVNVYQHAHATVGVRDEPAMNGAWTTPNTCTSGASASPADGYVYRASIPPTPCSITVHGTFDVGDQPGSVGSSVVYVNDSKTGTSTAMNPIQQTGPTPADDWEWAGNVTLDPTAVNNGAGLSQNFTAVGQHRFSFCYVKTTGSLNNQPAGTSCGGVSGKGKKNNSTGQTDCGNGSGGNPVCTGDVLFSTNGGASNNSSGGTQQATYLYDPVYSDPLTRLELLDGSGNPITNSLPPGGSIPTGTRIRLEELGLDTYRTTVLHDSVQGSGNRTGAADCGQGNGASGLKGAIENGCPAGVQQNFRATVLNGPASYSCSPSDFPTTGPFIQGHNNNPDPPPDPTVRDCVGDPTGNKTGPISQGMNNLLDCTADPNHWDPTKDSKGQNIQPNDPRLRDVFLTTYGVLDGSGDYPVVTLAAFYITGWDGAPSSCNGVNEPQPRDYTGKGTSVWGHYYDYADLTTGTNPSNDPCDLGNSIILCKPTLVR